MADSTDWIKKILGTAPSGLLDNEPTISGTIAKAVQAQGQLPLDASFPGFAGVSAETDFGVPNVRIVAKKTGVMVSMGLIPMVGLSSKGPGWVSYTCTIAVPELLHISNESLAKIVINATRDVIDFPSKEVDGHECFSLMFELNMKQPKLPTTLENCYGLIALISVEVGKEATQLLAANYQKMLTNFTDNLDETSGE